MDSAILQDSLQLVNQTIMESGTHASSFNGWMWLAILEFGFIALLLFGKKKKGQQSVKQKFREQALNDSVDFKNLNHSFFHAQALYDELKKKCHPDRFPTDKEKNAIAENLFQEITKNKHNMKKLEELKGEAMDKLHINF